MSRIPVIEALPGSSRGFGLCKVLGFTVWAWELTFSNQANSGARNN